MAGITRKWFVASLLVLCVGIHALELSGRWDRTLPDVDDEAGLVAVVLCIGIAVSVAGRLLSTIRLSRLGIVVEIVLVPVRDQAFVTQLAFSRLTNSPPLPLRI